MNTENGRGLRQPALVNEAPSGLRPSGFDPARMEPHVIDLDWEAWQTLVKAAAESDWIPPEYFVNDWVSDCAEFLRHGSPSPEWQPIETVPLYTQVLFGSYYDAFVLRPPFVPIWRMTEGHAYEWQGGFDFSLDRKLERRPTHWMHRPAPPSYTPSEEQRAIASGMSAGTAETRSGSGLQPASPVGNAETPESQQP